MIKGLAIIIGQDTKETVKDKCNGSFAELATKFQKLNK